MQIKSANRAGRNGRSFRVILASVLSRWGSPRDERGSSVATGSGRCCRDSRERDPELVWRVDRESGGAYSLIPPNYARFAWLNCHFAGLFLLKVPAHIVMPRP